MQLVRFNGHDRRREIFVNPEDVSTVLRSGDSDDRVEIKLRSGQASAHVQGTLEDVVDALLYPYDDESPAEFYDAPAKDDDQGEQTVSPADSNQLPNLDAEAKLIMEVQDDA